MIDPRAVVDPKAKLAPDVTVGAFAVIEADVEIGPGCQIGPSMRVSRLELRPLNCCMRAARDVLPSSISQCTWSGITTKARLVTWAAACSLFISRTGTRPLKSSANRARRRQVTVVTQ